jgi:hypothetical protein
MHLQNQLPVVQKEGIPFLKELLAKPLRHSGDNGQLEGHLCFDCTNTTGSNLQSISLHSSIAHNILDTNLTFAPTRSMPE